MHGGAILEVQVKVERATHAGHPTHAGKVDADNVLKLDVNGWLVDKDETLVQRVEETRGGTMGTRDGCLVVTTAKQQIKQ